ncbi:MAG TPA: hypothetical protein VFI73_13425, partial [Candidatus Nitrosopolaris sp.]|nr:hypothetical protein [Candidatus Nitrosopolaris sp.]
MLIHTKFHITNLKYQRLGTQNISKLLVIRTNILVITLTVLVIFLPVSALSTSEARSEEHSGLPNLLAPKIMDVQQFFPPTCAQFPHCTAIPSISKNQSTIISPLAKNSSSNTTIVPKLASPSLLPTKFVRGNVTRFGNSVYFGPYPTDDEFQLLKKNGFNVFVSL